MFNLAKIFVTFFYIGFIKFAPGTVGSVISLYIIFIIKNNTNTLFFFIIFIFLFLISIILINIYIKVINKDDPAEVIIYEFLGIFLIFFIYDYVSNINSFTFILLSLIFFRLFDILKPFPINLIDNNINNSFGIIVDDLLATGGTLKAAAELVEKCGATVVGMGLIIELNGLGGRGLLDKYNLYSLVQY